MIKKLVTLTIMSVLGLSVSTNTAWAGNTDFPIIRIAKHHNIEQLPKTKKKLAGNERFITFDGENSIAYRVNVTDGSLKGQYWLIHERYEGIHALVADDGNVYLADTKTLKFNYVYMP